MASRKERIRQWEREQRARYAAPVEIEFAEIGYQLEDAEASLERAMRAYSNAADRYYSGAITEARLSAYRDKVTQATVNVEQLNDRYIAQPTKAGGVPRGKSTRRNRRIAEGRGRNARVNAQVQSQVWTRRRPQAGKAAGPRRVRWQSDVRMSPGFGQTGRFL